MIKSKIAVAQTNSTQDVQKNLNTAVKFVEVFFQLPFGSSYLAAYALQDAAAQGANLIAFPENFLLLGTGKGLELSETIEVMISWYELIPFYIHQ